MLIFIVVLFMLYHLQKKPNSDKIGYKNSLGNLRGHVY